MLLPRVVGAQVTGFMERVAPVVDDTIGALANVRFVEDPVAGVRYSRATSIVSSAYKRAMAAFWKSKLSSLSGE